MKNNNKKKETILNLQKTKKETDLNWYTYEQELDQQCQKSMHS